MKEANFEYRISNKNQKVNIFINIKIYKHNIAHQQEKNIKNNNSIDIFRYNAKIIRIKFFMIHLFIINKSIKYK